LHDCLPRFLVTTTVIRFHQFTFEFKRGFKRAKKAMLPPPPDVPRGEDNSREVYMTQHTAAHKCISTQLTMSD